MRQSKTQILKRAFCVASLIACALPIFADPPVPRDGWTLASNGQDLIGPGLWQCVPGVTLGPAGQVVLKTADAYVTPVNTLGPRLLPQGDFSLIASISPRSGSGWVTLIGSQGGGPGKQFWEGLKRIDVGSTGGGLNVLIWPGTSSSPVSQSFAGDVSANPVTIEIARVGAKFVFFAAGVEVGRMDDPGLFASGSAYLALNAAPQSELWVSALAAAVPSGMQANLTVALPTTAAVPRSGNGLRDLTANSGFLIGSIVDPEILSNSTYTSVLGSEFNLAVAGNALKFDAIHPAPGTYNFCPADQAVAFAQANGMKFRGHTLVWYSQVPDWVQNGKFSRDDLIAILHEHINTVVSHYRGRIFAWDVVNEVLAYTPPYDLTPSIWMQTIGPEYIEMAFRWVHEADPDAKLYYNEVGAEGLGPKSDKVIALVKDLQSKGVPIDGVGMQMHLRLAPSGLTTVFDQPLRGADVAANMQALAALGMSVQITEMDIQIPNPLTPDKFQAQAQAYADITAACLAAPNCQALLTWGLTDALSWVPQFFPGYGGALLFDGSYQPKPAYQAVASALAAH